MKILLCETQECNEAAKYKQLKLQMQTNRMDKLAENHKCESC